MHRLVRFGYVIISSAYKSFIMRSAHKKGLTEHRLSQSFFVVIFIVFIIVLNYMVIPFSKLTII